MPPSAIVDTDLDPVNNRIYYALEENKIWKATSLGGGNASWSDVTPTLVNGTLGAFIRIKATRRAGLVYVIGYGTLDGLNKPFCLRTENYGLTWIESWINETLTSRAYTVTYVHAIKAETIPPPGSNEQHTHTHVRHGDSINTVNPWAMANRLTYPGSMPAGSPDWRWMATDATTINAYGSSYGTYGVVYAHSNELLSPANYAVADGWLDDYFGGGGWAEEPGTTKTHPLDANRIYVKFALTHWWGFGGPVDVLGESWVFWNIPEVIIPKAFDVSVLNPTWLYLGLTDKIIASEDMGMNWFDFYTLHGAYDICCDPLLGGAIYYWSTDGNLNLLVKNTLGQVGTLTQSGLMTETALDMPLRIARDTNSGRIWATPNGTKITMRNLLSNTDQKTGLSGATGIHAYTGGLLICCDSTKIYISNNYGATWTDVTGNWATYANGINSHRTTMV